MPTTIIPFRASAFTHLHPSQRLKISNPTGLQVVDIWVFSAPLPQSPLPSSPSSSSRPTTPPSPPFTYLSTTHTRSSLLKLRLSINDTLLDNARAAMLTLLEDTTYDGHGHMQQQGSQHDMLFAACDKQRYEQLGVPGHHASCAENLEVQLGKAAAAASMSRDEAGMSNTNSVRMSGAVDSAARAVERGGWTPDPVNLFMGVGVERLEGGRGGELRMEGPSCAKGGCVVFRAEVECVVVMSACPMDLVGSYNGHSVEYEVLES